MQNFREKYAYKVSLYLSLSSVFFITLHFHFTNLANPINFLGWFLIVIGLFGVLAWPLSLIFRLSSIDSLKKHKDLLFFFLASASSVFLSIFFWNGVAPLFCKIVSIGIGGVQYDCSLRSLPQEAVSFLWQHLAMFHYYIFLLGSFVSMVLLVKYLLELRKRENSVIE